MSDEPTSIDDPHLVETRIESATLLQGGFLEVRRDIVALPDGQPGSREYIFHPGAVAVVPLLDDGRVVLVRQFRYPVGKVMLEIPAGKLDRGEEGIACAQRELMEETGYTAREWAWGGEIHNASAYSTESIWIWFARGLVAGPQRLDEGEFVEIVRCTEAEMEELDVSGALSDVKTVIALHWLRAWRAGRRQLRWAEAATAAAAAPPSVPFDPRL